MWSMWATTVSHMDDGIIGHVPLVPVKVSFVTVNTAVCCKLTNYTISYNKVKWPDFPFKQLIVTEIESKQQRKYGKDVRVWL